MTQTPEIKNRTGLQKCGLAFLFIFAGFHFTALAFTLLPKAEWYPAIFKTYTKTLRLEQEWRFFAGNFERVNESLAVRIQTASSDGTKTWRWVYVEPSFNITDLTDETLQRFSFFEPKLATDVLEVLRSEPGLKDHFLKYYIRKFSETTSAAVTGAELVVLRWPFKDYEDLSQVRISDSQQEVIYAAESF
jgi:hypothetical protein